MPIDVHPTRMRGRTPEQITAEQKEQAARDKARANAQKTAATNAVTVGRAREATATNVTVEKRMTGTATGTAVATPDARTNVQAYIDAIAPAGIAGRLVKFSKEGAFTTADDGETVPETAEFIALCDETLVGWIKFNREKDSDAPPDRVMGLLYDGFVMPPRNTLGDMDLTQWEPGLAGTPEDPWHHQICLVLQNTETREIASAAKHFAATIA